MTFTLNPELDRIRAKYKREYDYIFNKIHDAFDDPKLLDFLRDKEKKLHIRTRSFINKHAQYFSNKRKWHFEKMEKWEMFGNKPKFEAETKNESKYEKRFSRGMVRYGE